MEPSAKAGMRSAAVRTVSGVVRSTGAVPLVRRLFRSSEAALVALAVALGIAAGLLTFAINRTAHGIQSLIYNLGGGSLSSAQSVSFWSLLALPIGGVVLGFGTRA